MMRSLGRSLIGAVCFVVGAAVLAAHPNREWREITGEPEHVTIEIESPPGRTEGLP